MKLVALHFHIPENKDFANLLRFMVKQVGSCIPHSIKQRLGTGTEEAISMPEMSELLAEFEPIPDIKIIPMYVIDPAGKCSTLSFSVDLAIIAQLDLNEWVNQVLTYFYQNRFKNGRIYFKPNDGLSAERHRELVEAICTNFFHRAFWSKVEHAGNICITPKNAKRHLKAMWHFEDLKAKQS
jgi:hypothetical protein